MALRYRRRIKILPGIHLNISKSGISTSLGVRGANITFGKNGRYINTGIPGSGVYWRSRVGAGAKERATPVASETSQAEAIAAGSEGAAAEAPQVPFHSHHLHWWKVGLFFALMIVAGATKLNALIGLFWLGYTAYWFLLLVRLIMRKSREGRNTSVHS